MKKRNALMIAAVAMVLSNPMFAQGANETKSPTAEKAGPVTINYYTWYDGCHQAMIDTFNETHTDVQVNGHILENADYETKLTTLLSGRADIDCFMEKTPTDAFNQYDNGYLEPLDDYLAAAGGNDAVDNYPSIATINDQVIAIPWRGCASYTYYNTKVFEAAGVPTPDTFVEAGTWTWDKFEEISNAIHDANPEFIGSTIYLWGAQGFFEATQNGDFFINDAGEIGDTTSTLKQLEMRKRLEDNGAMWKLIDMKVTKTHYTKQFYDGKLGMVVIGEWFPGQIITGIQDGLLKDFGYDDIGITRMPCDGDYVTFGLPVSNSITTYSKKKDAAWEFINWMSGPEGATVAASYGIMPANPVEDSNEIITANLPKGNNSAMYYLEPKVCAHSNYSKYGRRVENEFSKLQEDFLLGNIDSAQFTSKFNDALEEIVETTY